MDSSRVPTDGLPDWLSRFRADCPGGDSREFRSWAASQPELWRSQETVERLAAQLDLELRGEALLGDLLPSGHSPADLSFFRRRASKYSAGRGELVAGQRVGRFVLREFLGQGGMGQVWAAEDTSLRRRVALKLVLPGRLDERSLERFIREARAGGRLVHPNVVQTYACGEDSGRAWIAQELVEGAWTLRDFLDELRKEGQLPRSHFRLVAGLTARLARGLHAAHSAGVIHRDLKPANILLSEGRVPKLADFGLAQLRDDSFLSMSGDVAGTWAYMSPEQVAGKRQDLDHRSDVFSLGVVLYELLTQRRPFDGDTAAQLAERIRHEEPLRADVVHSLVPLELALIAAKAMEKSPDARYQTAQELAEDLERFLADEPIHARPPGALDRARKWVRRNPTLSAAASVLLIALGIVGGLALNLARQTELARLQRSSVLRLSAQVDLDELVAEQSTLWPATAELVPELEDWVARAEQLLESLPEHRQTLAELLVDQSEYELGAGPESGADLGDRSTRWWRERLERMVSGLEALDRDLLRPAAVTASHGWSVRRRLELARELDRAAQPGGDTHAAWGRYLAEIHADLPGLHLAPRPDLLPLGRDPRSGLWEFSHLPSGEPASRREDGELVLAPQSGILLVLIPGGRDHVGSQGLDPGGPNFDPEGLAQPAPVREVELAPFLLSKFEVTQEQWEYATGQRPSHVWTATAQLPVEQVTWTECARFCERLGLVLPTEDEWEYAARAGTDTPFWTGRELDQLVAAANVADQSQRSVTLVTWVGHDPIDDGYPSIAPIGSFAPSPFGLHEIHGNVWEWCQDSYPLVGNVSRLLPLEPGSPPPVGVDVRHAYRGGSFNDRSNHARSANRLMDVAGYKTMALGLRPALRL
jgi:formylglycine-generating enzyme required for sulfatase activity/tRNA A-37 threonylcarbamoyl transferase component Bud32